MEQDNSIQDFGLVSIFLVSCFFVSIRGDKILLVS